MPGLLTTASVMMCPHGGTVQPITTNTRVRAGWQLRCCSPPTRS